MNTSLNATVIIISTNKSGGPLFYGDVVIPSSAANRGVTTTVDTSLKAPVGVVVDLGGIANNAQGAIAWQGYVPRINLIAAASRADGLVISASAGKATVSASSSGDAFGMALSDGTTPDAFLFGRVPADPTPGFETVGGRLTLTTGTPVTTSDVTGAATLYYTPFVHGRIGLYSGGWAVYTTAEVSVSLGAISDATNYDVFAYYTGSVVALELLAWASDTARATALARQDGILVKSGDATRRYLGTIRASGAGVGEDSQNNRLVWNMYNRVERVLLLETVDTSWSMSIGGPRPINGNTNYKIKSVIGQADDPLKLKAILLGYVSGGSGTIGTGIGVNSTSVDSSNIRDAVSIQAGNALAAIAEYVQVPSIGYTYYQWLEIATGSNMFGYGDTSQLPYYKNGMIGTVKA